MKIDLFAKDFLRCRLGSLLFSACLALAGCAGTPDGAHATRFDGPGVAPVLAYYQMLGRMSAAELNRERTVLAALPHNPNTHLRMAMLLGHPRGPQDLGRALGLLEGIVKSTEPSAVNLNFLAKILIDNYTERQKQELAFDRQGGQLKESQRRAVELQEKLDGLADIERTLPVRRGALRSASPGGAK